MLSVVFIKVVGMILSYCFQINSIDRYHIKYVDELKIILVVSKKSWTKLKLRYQIIRQIMIVITLITEVFNNSTFFI